MAGRLTLSWANKDKALLSHGESGYEWVEQGDARVNEVRLLDQVSLVADAAGTPEDNLLIRGDSLDALRALVRTPEYADVYRGKVKLVYIDPPFNTGQAFEHYDDSLEHSVWLGMMRERLVLIRDLLAPDGSVWVHLDDAEMAYCKVLMDEIFGRSNFVATMVWQKRYSRENRPAIGTAQDYILVFTANAGTWKESRNLIPIDERTRKQYRNPNADPRGPWRTIPMNAMGYRPNQMYDIVAPSGNIKRPPAGSCWKYVPETFERLKAEGRIYFGSDGDAQPAMIRYLDEVPGLVPWTWLPHEEVGHGDEAKREIQSIFDGVEAFSTPKPERLLERVIHIGSNPGDIVLDCFAGSGTTAAVAHKMGRRWVTVELSDSTASTFTKPRLEKVVNGEDPGGITKSVGWAGGGGFRELRIAPSTFATLPLEFGTGTVIAANLPTGQLQRSVTAQLGYTLIRDSDTETTSTSQATVFTGARGRSRLAVIDGVADETVVGDVLAALEAGQTAVIAATGFTPGAEPALRAASIGSRCIRIPGGLFGTGGAVIR